MRAYAILAVLLGTCHAAETQLSFEVVSVKPARERPRGRYENGGGELRGLATPVNGPVASERHGRIDLPFITLESVIQRAFTLNRDQIVGPSWLQTLRYDIVAKVPEGTSQDQIPTMLQTLLSERFRFAAHHEKRRGAVYALVVGKKGLKIRPTTDSGPSSMKVSMGQVRRISGRLTINNLINVLAASVDRPIEDRTGIRGALDVKMEWAAANASEEVTASLPSVFTALQETLGLRLVPYKGPTDVLVVDHIQKQPTEN